ncbi:TolC family protein [Candidatus Dependentiae bacterium]|nr:TolC family protein [Candidatus Dependentiae bacterium]
MPKLAEVSYERSRIVDNVQVGISYERDFEKKVSGVGPALGINIPLFNTNYGNVERAKSEINKAEKNLLAQQRTIFANIFNQLSRYNSYLAQIEHYRHNVLPPVMQAIKFSKEFFDKMQMSMIVFLETQIDLFQSKVKLLDLTYRASLEYIDLEFSVGAQLENVAT